MRKIFVFYTVIDCGLYTITVYTEINFEECTEIHIRLLQWVGDTSKDSPLMEEVKHDLKSVSKRALVRRYKGEYITTPSHTYRVNSDVELFERLVRLLL